MIASSSQLLSDDWLVRIARWILKPLSVYARVSRHGRAGTESPELPFDRSSALEPTKPGLRARVAADNACPLASWRERFSFRGF